MKVLGRRIGPARNVDTWTREMALACLRQPDAGRNARRSSENDKCHGFRCCYSNHELMYELQVHRMSV